VKSARIMEFGIFVKFVLFRGMLYVLLDLKECESSWLYVAARLNTITLIKLIVINRYTLSAVVL